MKVTVAQLNPVVGDISGNTGKIADTLSLCKDESTDLVIFPELFLTGYPPGDFLERPWFIKKAGEAISKAAELSKDYPDTGILAGAPVPTGKNTGSGLYNSAVLIHNGKVIFTHKSLLPVYDVFDEVRYFDPAPDVRTVRFKDEVIGISICEDAWYDDGQGSNRNYLFDPVELLAGNGATLLVNISASPFYAGKEEVRHRIFRNHAKKHNLPVVFVNQVGGNDELIFDGRSMCFNDKGELVEIFPPFRECVKTVDLDAGKAVAYTPQDKTESVHDALVLGIRDYMKKSGFTKAVVGLSGGIDSAVTCCLVKEAVGSANVLGVSMPGPYSSKGSFEDAHKLAENLGIEFMVIPVSGVYSSYIEALKEAFAGCGTDTTEENIQARIRGNILMALSNKFGHILLTTGNKSELAVGYCTLYGDMSGGLAVISDVPKTMVYELARFINRNYEVIPQDTIEKPPSAELRPDQEDQDTLPPYGILDRILYYYIDEGCSPDEIIGKGFEPGIVEWVVRAVDRSEFKRRQAPPGLKVTTKAFGMGRRMPLAAKYEY
ncbi:MAG: NAD+ synthase [Candidatus Methanoperedens sp.]|jgi:NAD+ synthase (glutamine-hydrolysing)|nr:NAD+ synthase [Candidatus Methanoperedens sp.]PKL53068.1 MAG: NAD+ synthase [Candidatus Methanoperedenaceae archaeon HGW-Methanoperedenaceae-1]